MFTRHVYHAYSCHLSLPWMVGVYLHSVSFYRKPAGWGVCGVGFEWGCLCGGGGLMGLEWFSGGGWFSVGVWVGVGVKVISPHLGL